MWLTVCFSVSLSFIRIKVPAVCHMNLPWPGCLGNKMNSRVTQTRPSMLARVIDGESEVQNLEWVFWRVFGSNMSSPIKKSINPSQASTGYIWLLIISYFTIFLRHCSVKMYCIFPCARVRIHVISTVTNQRLPLKEKIRAKFKTRRRFATGRSKMSSNPNMSVIDRYGWKCLWCLLWGFIKMTVQALEIVS